MFPLTLEWQIYNLSQMSQKLHWMLLYFSPLGLWEICTIMFYGQNQTKTENLRLTERKPAVNKGYTQKDKRKTNGTPFLWVLFHWREMIKTVSWQTEKDHTVAIVEELCDV